MENSFKITNGTFRPHQVHKHIHVHITTPCFSKTVSLRKKMCSKDSAEQTDRKTRQYAL